MKIQTVSLRVPAFLLSPWIWGALILGLGFRLGLSLVPQRAAAREPKATAAAAPPAWPVDDQGYRLLNGIRTMLPCGHLATGQWAGGGMNLYTCSHGHRFRPYGSWYAPD